MTLDAKTLESSTLYAANHFYGKLSKDGTPAILHSLNVMLKISRDFMYRENYYLLCICAVLHDVVEDCNSSSIEDINKLFGEEVAKVVSLLTKKKRTDYKDYINNLLKEDNKVAITVKYYDIVDNYDRCIWLKDKEAVSRISAKYNWALETICEGLGYYWDTLKFDFISSFRKVD